MDNPLKSDVIGRCGGDEKTEWPCRTDKSRTLKKTNKKTHQRFKENVVLNNFIFSIAQYSFTWTNFLLTCNFLLCTCMFYLPLLDIILFT